VFLKDSDFVHKISYTLRNMQALLRNVWKPRVSSPHNADNVKRIHIGSSLVDTSEITVSETERIQQLCSLCGAPDLRECDCLRPLRIWGSQSGNYEESRLLAYNAVWSGESKQTFRRNMSPQSSVLMIKPSKKPSWSRQQVELCLLPASW
jgi:hypothetical protein